jgi:hypothetical protein
MRPDLKLCGLPAVVATVFIASATPAWSQPSETTLSPPSRAHHALVYDAANDRTLLIGGSTPADSGGRSYKFFEDLWSFDGHRWTLLGASGAQRSGQAVAYDSKRNRVLAFGGYCPCRGKDAGRYPDLLELRNNRWEIISTTERPVTDAGMVYDSRRDRLVLFGGSDASRTSVGDTWEFDGERWTKFEGAGPGARSAFSMAYDQRRGRTVLLGGYAAGARAPSAETWEFDGVVWARIATEGPSPRAGAGMAYDANRGVVLVFGGNDDKDTWAWDGRQWAKLSNAGPDIRAMAALAYDSRRDRVVLFGGRSRVGPPTRDFDDTWHWDGNRWQRIP